MFSKHLRLLESNRKSASKFTKIKSSVVERASLSFCAFFFVANFYLVFAWEAKARGHKSS